MKVPGRFFDAIGADPGNCVLVVGAGLSKRGVRKGGAGIPDWDELMQLMVRHLEDAGRCDKAKSDQLRAMLKEDPPRYLDVLEDFSKAHSDDRDGYETFLRRHLKPDDLAESDLHKLILRIGFWGIASYNFDLVFEKHFDKQAPLVYPELMEQIGQFQRRGFFAKIHGCISRPASRLVLTKTSYDELRRHPNYSNLLTTVLLAHKVLCVGFSLRDPDFQSILTDLKDHWVENLPPLYALMRDPGEDARSTWLKKGVDILPYADHGEVQAFFQQLAETCKTGHDRAWSAPLGAEPRTAVDRQAKELRELITEWRGKQKIAEMDAVMSRHLSRLPSPAEREASLFRVAAMCRLQERPHLCHHLIAVGTPACLDLTRQLIPSAAGDDRLYPLSPDRIHVPVHRFIMADPVWEYERDALESLLKWVLDADWSKHGVDLSITFREVLSRVANSPRERRLDSLYRVTEHIPQAAAEIEKIALAPGFVRGHDQVEGSWDKRLVEEIKREKLRRVFFPHPRTLSPAAMLAQAASLEDPEDEYPPCIRMAAEFLLSDFVHRAHLGLHSSSSLYDPAKAREIVDALAALRSPRQQITVLWAINHWAEDHRGLGSLQMDAESLREGLLVPLWWRYSSEMRMQYLAESGRHRGMVPFPRWTGQEFLLCDMMGLRYDVDEDFRKEFNKSLDYYDTGRNEERYIPWPLQGLWRDRELSYEIVEDLPPELARRVVTRRVNPEGSQHADKQWEEAEEEVQALLENRDALRKIVSADRKDYVIDNLLGAYFPAKRRVVLYRRMLSLAASDLGIDSDALSTIVYIHETVHAFAHLGRDLSDRMWSGCVAPEAQVPEYQVSRTMEAIAQFYTYKLLERLDDKRLMDAFAKLEEHSDPVYREWRKTQHFTLEAMRAVLIQLRSLETEWPPQK